jgi:hypothetical protein
MTFSGRKILLAMVILATTSCMKAPSQTEDLGPQAQALEVQSAIQDAWGSVDPATIRKDEFMSIEQNQKISTLDPHIVYKESTQVLDRQVGDEDITYSLLLRSTSMDQTGNFKPVTSTNQEIVVKKSSATANMVATSRSSPALPGTLEALQKSMTDGRVGLFQSDDDDKVHERFLGLQTVLSMYDACVKTPSWDVSCHNLSVTQGWSFPPVGIASKPNCGGIPNCQISYKKISFDLVVNLPTDDGKDTHQEKVIYDFTVSPDVPYLSRLTEFCYQGLVIASGQRILVKICNSVQNYEEGIPNP